MKVIKGLRYWDTFMPEEFIIISLDMVVYHRLIAYTKSYYLELEEYPRHFEKVCNFLNMLLEEKI